MGSFNMGCGLSNLSIDYGDRVGFVLLDTPVGSLNPDAWPREPGRAFEIYTTDRYRPVLPPVFGTYDDYGQIIDIEPSRTTAVIEAEFQRPVADVLRCVASLRGIYDTCGEIAEIYLQPGHLLADFRATEAAQMISLGFTAHAAGGFTFGGYRLHRDAGHGWCVTSQTTGELLRTGIAGHNLATRLDVFAEVTGQYPGFAPADWPRIIRLHRLSGMFFLTEVFLDMRTLLRRQAADAWRETRSFEAEWDEFVTEVRAGEAGDTLAKLRAWDLDAGRLLRDRTAIQLPAPELVLSYADSYDFRGVRDLVAITTAVNRMFAPSISGEQFGNTEASRRLNTVTNRILRARRAEASL